MARTEAEVDRLFQEITLHHLENVENIWRDQVFKDLEKWYEANDELRKFKERNNLLPEKESM